MFEKIVYISALLLQVSANFQYQYPQYPYSQYPINGQYAHPYPYQYPMYPSIPNYGQQYQYPTASYQQSQFSVNQEPFQNLSPESELPMQYQYPGYYNQPPMDNRAPFHAQPSNYQHSIQTSNGNIPIEIIDVSNLPPHMYPLLNPRIAEPKNETISLSQPTIEVTKPLKSNTVIKGNTSQIKINRMIDNNGKPIISVVTGKPEVDEPATEKKTASENDTQSKKNHSA